MQPGSASSLASFQKPAWLTDLALGVKETYDNNIFGVSGLAAKEQGSWITTVSPKIGFNFAPFLGDQTVVKALTFGYAPEFATYHDEPSESYTAHRLVNTLKGKADAFSFDMENSFNYINGSDEGHTWSPPYNVASAFASAAVRERRDQFQDKGKIAFQYDWDDWFIRPTASLLYYDLHTNFKTTPGELNFADRYDANGGVDFGYKIDPQMALTLGYRYGHQYQQQYPTAIDPLHLSSSSDYQRMLVGFEGKPWKWLTASIQAGPDFRDYPGNTATHTTPLNDKTPVKYYGEAGLRADITPQDALSFKYKQWQWVSSLGKLPVYESLFDLGYHRKLNDKLSLDLGARLLSGDQTSGNTATSLRNDWLYNITAGFTYNFTKSLSANLSYSANLARNYQDYGIVNPQYREFTQHLVSLGAQFKF